jgi:hypothetical protein
MNKQVMDATNTMHRKNRSVANLTKMRARKNNIIKLLSFLISLTLISSKVHSLEVSKLQNNENLTILSDILTETDWDSPFLLSAGTSRRISLEEIPSNIDFVSKSNTSMNA